MKKGETKIENKFITPLLLLLITTIVIEERDMVPPRSENAQHVENNTNISAWHVFSFTTSLLSNRITHNFIVQILIDRGKIKQRLIYFKANVAMLRTLGD